MKIQRLQQMRNRDSENGQNLTYHAVVVFSTQSQNRFHLTIVSSSKIYLEDQKMKKRL